MRIVTDWSGTQFADQDDEEKTLGDQWLYQIVHENDQILHELRRIYLISDTNHQLIKKNNTF